MAKRHLDNLAALHDCKNTEKKLWKLQKVEIKGLDGKYERYIR